MFSATRLRCEVVICFVMEGSVEPACQPAICDRPDKALRNGRSLRHRFRYEDRFDREAQGEPRGARAKTWERNETEFPSGVPYRPLRSPPCVVPESASSAG